MGSRWNKIKEAVADSISVADALRKMKLDPRGLNYRKFKRIVKEQQIDTSHFKCQSHGTPQQIKIQWRDVLVKNSCHEITTLRKNRLIKDGILKNVCSECGIDTWRSKPIVLQIDHINGIHDDNRLENLRLLCPNCHSQTDTFCGKNIDKPKTFCKCGRVMCKESKMCFRCANDRKSGYSKIKWPSTERLKSMLESKSYLQVARELGVSDNAIRKHLRVRSKPNQATGTF